MHGSRAVPLRFPLHGCGDRAAGRGLALLEEFSVALGLLDLGLTNQPPMHWKFYRPLTGKQAVARNGYLPQCKVLTGMGPVTVKASKVRVCSGNGVKFNI